MKLVLGQAVRWSHPLYRTFDIERLAKVWTDNPSPYMDQHSEKYRNDRDSIRDGIVVGRRTLSDGRYEYPDSYSGFRSFRSYPAYVVAFDLYRRPALVLPAHVFPAGVMVNPDCRDGKHRSCTGTGWDETNGEACECPCACHTKEKGQGNV